MKLHVNMPSYPKGTPLEVMGIGPVKNGDVIELTDVQVGALEANGMNVPSSGDMYVYQEAKSSPVKEPKTTNLPGIEEIAEKERVKSTPKTEDK